MCTFGVTWHELYTRDRPITHAIWSTLNPAITTRRYIKPLATVWQPEARKPQICEIFREIREIPKISLKGDPSQKKVVACMLTEGYILVLHNDIGHLMHV